MSEVKTEQLGLALDQIPYSSLKAISDIFKEGEKKYGKDNWKKGVNDKDYQIERWNHAVNHLMLFKEGDTSEKHLAKVAWFCITQLWLEQEEKSNQLPSNSDTVFDTPNNESEESRIAEDLKEIEESKKEHKDYQYWDTDLKTWIETDNPKPHMIWRDYCDPNWKPKSGEWYYYWDGVSLEWMFSTSSFIKDRKVLPMKPYGT
jgi:hypothetical protein